MNYSQGNIKVILDLIITKGTLIKKSGKFSQILKKYIAPEFLLKTIPLISVLCIFNLRNEVITDSNRHLIL